jgi:hypothetical protein
MGDFFRTIKNFGKTVDEHNSKIFRKVVFDLYAEIMKRTPVDTGLARGNWRIGVGRAPTGVLERVNKTGSRSAEEINNVPTDIREKTVVFIANNLVYIVPLERGWSKQAPNGMVSGAMNAITAAMRSGI